MAVVEGREMLMEVKFFRVLVMVNGGGGSRFECRGNGSSVCLVMDVFRVLVDVMVVVVCCSGDSGGGCNLNGCEGGGIQ